MNDIQLFSNDEYGVVRVVLGDDGEPLLVATDIAKILGYRDAAQLTRLLEDDEKGTQILRTPGGSQQLSVITEAGFYRAVMTRRSKFVKDEAAKETVIRFQRWVTHEVLPALRAKGVYAAPMTRDEDEDIMLARAVLAADRKIKRLTDRAESAEHKCEVLRIRNQELSDKAGMFDACMKGERWQSFTEVARFFHQYDPRMTRKKLFELAHTDGLIDRSKQATMKAIDRGYLKNYQPPASFDQSTGEPMKPKAYAKWTAKGVNWAFDRWVRVERVPFQMLTEELPLKSAI